MSHWRKTFGGGGWSVDTYFGPRNKIDRKKSRFLVVKASVQVSSWIILRSIVGFIRLDDQVSPRLNTRRIIVRCYTGEGPPFVMEPFRYAIEGRSNIRCKETRVR